MSVTEPIYNRMSGRVNNKIALNAMFYHNGVLADPYAIRLIKIFKKSVEDVNLMSITPLPAPDDSVYPLPVIRNGVGDYKLIFDVPRDFVAPDIYFDVWYFIADYPSDISGFDLDDESLWISKCNKFWLYPDGWYVDDKLMSMRFGFEPIDVRFQSGEVRYLEVGLMPLPLYDYDYNQTMTIIPFIDAYITISTRNCEMLVNNEKMEMGLRQGSYRTNPFVAKYLLDTNKFLKGTYDYQITLNLFDSQKIVSPKYTITIS